MAKQRSTILGVGRFLMTTWLWIDVMGTLVFLGCSTAAHRCIFDEIHHEQRVGQTYVNYTQGRGGSRSKRDIIDAYQPLRVRSIVQDVENLKDSVQVERLETIMGSATSVLSKLFSVYPVDGPLILQRSDSACKLTWNQGPNIGKCGGIYPAYTEECLDNFVIPDDHLGGLWTWDEMIADEAVTHFAIGAGIPDADTVFYVKSEHTDRCDSGDVLAYASYCKTDQYGRPVAGVINFCPDPLLSADYDEEKYILLAIHESFHVLGFSSSLFSSFKECTQHLDGLECESRENVLSNEGGQPTIHSPAVSAAAQAHFGCHDEDMGIPLENLAGTGSSSHWEMRTMFGSIMAPVILQPDSTYLDNLTLALFEDSGWYRVSYEHADDFLWGKGQGCDFGLPELCATNFTQFFCNDSSSGCDHVSLHKATCSTNEYLDGCKVFWPLSDDQCTAASADPASHQYNATGESSGSGSRCFLANILREGMCTPADLEGRCYSVQCNNSSTSLDIRVADSDWLPCPQGTVIQVSGYDGEIHCPAADIVCRNGSSLLSLVDPRDLSSTTAPAPTVSQVNQQTAAPGNLSLSLEFTDLAYSEVDEGSEVIAFTGILIQNIADVAQIPENLIEVCDITEGSVTVIIRITQGADSAVSVQDAYSSLSSAVVSGQFCIEYKNTNYTASSVSIIAVSTPPTSPSPTPDPDVSVVSTPPWPAVVPALLAGAAVLTLLLLRYLWQRKKSSRVVAPAPRPTPRSTPREGVKPGEAYMLK